MVFNNIKINSKKLKSKIHGNFFPKDSKSYLRIKILFNAKKERSKSKMS